MIIVIELENLREAVERKNSRKDHPQWVILVIIFANIVDFPQFGN